MTIKEKCKVHILEYRDLIMANNYGTVANKLKEDAARDAKDFILTINLQQSALIMTHGNEFVEKEHKHLKEIFDRNRRLYDASKKSTCQKRITVCEIYDKNDILLSCESNRCDPEGGTCHRLGLVQNKNNYDVSSHCNWTHAEIMAIQALPSGSQPHKVIVYGHTFLCDNCERELKGVGVEKFETKELPI